jgi:ketosteroid isomerase-like protein
VNHDAEMALLHEIYSYWAEGNYRPNHFLHPDFELVFGSDFVDSASYKGIEQASAGWLSWLDGWSFWKGTPIEYRRVGDRVLVILEGHGVAKASGVELDQPGANVWEFRDGLGSRLTLYTRTETALRELGTD